MLKTITIVHLFPPHPNQTVTLYWINTGVKEKVRMVPFLWTKHIKDSSEYINTTE